MNLGQIRSNVLSNLNDAGVRTYSTLEVNQAINDGYSDVAAKCYCINKSATVNQVAQANYYDFLSLGVSDYLGTIAIFNLATQFWLRDDLSLRDFDRLRRDWERWNGAAQFWTPHSQKRVAIAPKLASTNGEQFTLWYWAQAPQLVNDTDVPLVASDMQPMLEWYATADCLEGVQEVTKAQPYWSDYKRDRIKYKDRCLRLAKADLLLRV